MLLVAAALYYIRVVHTVLIHHMCPFQVGPYSDLYASCCTPNHLCEDLHAPEHLEHCDDADSRCVKAFFQLVHMNDDMQLASLGLSLCAGLHNTTVNTTE